MKSLIKKSSEKRNTLDVKVGAGYFASCRIWYIFTTVKPRSNGSAFIGFSPLIGGNSLSLQPVFFEFSNLVGQNFVCISLNVSVP